MDLVTIIIPIYNIEDNLLRRCVKSVCEQSYGNLEIILVDDGSTDGTGSLCDKLALTDNRIKVYHKENGGSSSARNMGIDNATGEYIGFVDSDDYVDNDYMKLLMDAISKYNVKMAQISRDETDKDGNKLPDVCIPPKDETRITNKEQLRELLLHRGDASFCTRLSHKSLFENLRFPEGKLNEDFYLMINMLDRIDEYIILPNQSYHVYYREGSNSRKKDKNDFSPVFVDIVDNADFVEALVSKKYPELKEVAKRFALFQRLDYMLHIPIAQMTDDNEFYKNVVKYLRKNFLAMAKNKYLTGKNKVYLFLLTLMPKKTRIIHRIKMRGK